MPRARIRLVAVNTDEMRRARPGFRAASSGGMVVEPRLRNQTRPNIQRENAIFRARTIP